MARFFGTLIVILAFVTTVQARVHTITPTQYFAPPDAQPLEGYPALAVAIDGDSFIAIADRPSYRGAFLYRRGTDGLWSYSRTLLQTTVQTSDRRAGLVMKNNLAVVDIAGQAVIWEKVGTAWVQAQTQSPINLPGGYAISVDRILIGGDGCAYDGFIYQKASSGVWGVTGRLPSPGACVAGERDIELNYDYALINSPAGNVRAYRRNDTAIDWVSAGNFALQGQSAGRAGPLALQKTVAAAPGSTIYRRSGTTWTLSQTLMPADYAEGAGDAQAALYRDNVLITIEGLAQDAFYATPHLYAPDSTGKFQNVGILSTHGTATDIDISGNTIVAVDEDSSGLPMLAVYNLPTPLVPPNAIANDFDTRDVSGFQSTPAGAFALAGNTFDSIYRQSNASGDTAAVLTDSDWSYYQSVDVRIRPNQLNGTGAWVGPAIRYADANNYYFLSIYNDRIAINRRVSGVNAELVSASLSTSSVGRFHDVHFSIQRNPSGGAEGDLLVAQVDGDVVANTYDKSLTRGRAALLTHNARADFDNLYASPSTRDGLLYMAFLGGDLGRPLQTNGGTWNELIQQSPKGLRQSNTAVLATAVGGAPIGDQSVYARIRLEASGGTDPVPWFGVLARYRDPANYYYLSVRGSGQVQIRKIVNGVTTVLAAQAFTADLTQEHTYELRAYGDQLHAVVDGVVLATAHDSALPEGRYGVATYHAGVLVDLIRVEQP